MRYNDLSKSKHCVMIAYEIDDDEKSFFRIYTLGIIDNSRKLLHLLLFAEHICMKLMQVIEKKTQDRSC